MKQFCYAFLITLNLALLVGVNLPGAKEPDPVCQNAIAANTRLEGWRLEAHSSHEGGAWVASKGKRTKYSAQNKTTHQTSLKTALTSMQFMESK